MPPRWFPSLLIALVLLTFAPLFSAEFIRWDDPYTLHHNPRLNPPTARTLGAYWTEWRTGEYGLYVPVTYTLWAALVWTAVRAGGEATVASRPRGRQPVAEARPA